MITLQQFKLLTFLILELYSFQKIIEKCIIRIFSASYLIYNRKMWNVTNQQQLDPGDLHPHLRVSSSCDVQTSPENRTDTTASRWVGTICTLPTNFNKLVFEQFVNTKLIEIFIIKMQFLIDQNNIELSFLYGVC